MVLGGAAARTTPSACLRRLRAIRREHRCCITIPGALLSPPGGSSSSSRHPAPHPLHPGSSQQHLHSCAQHAAAVPSAHQPAVAAAPPHQTTTRRTATTSCSSSSSSAGASTDPSSGSSTSSSPPQQKHQMQERITLTDDEAALFDTLLSAARQAGSGTVLRAAGGWVRDKLLGKESSDIDIALDNMLGRDFADKVNDYLAAQGKETRTAAVIQSNPDQSKHLETARMKVNACWIDLVNLRSESYADGSRIPTMQFGTPLQDAERRDFTINSLFYNLNEGVVEDFTGRGLEDLRAGVLRTPLPPLQTFLDDPLRVMRAVRFSTRFGFPPEPAILEAAASDEVRQALGSKVSRERIGTELQGMFDGAAPTQAVRLLHQLRLLPQVFTPPPQLAALLGPDFGAPCVEAMAATEALLGALPELQLSTEDRRVLLLAALLLPLRRLTTPASKGSKQVPASAFIIRDSIKWRSKDVDAVALLHAHVADLAAVQQQLATGSAPGSADKEDAAGTAGAAAAGGDSAASAVDVRVRLGRIIRQLKGHWTLGALLMPLLELPCAAPLGVEPGASYEPGAGSSSSPAAAAAAAVGSPGAAPEGSDAGGDASAGAAAAAAQLQQRQASAVRSLLAAAAGFGLEDCWQWKPLLDGKQLSEDLGVPKGPQLGKMTAVVLDWMMAHPGGSKADCIAALKQQQQQHDCAAG